MAKIRTPEDTRADIAAARARLAAGVQGLVSQAHPAALKRDAADQVKAKALGLVASARAEVVDGAGVRWNRIGTVVLLSTGILLVAVVLRALKRLVFR